MKRFLLFVLLISNLYANELVYLHSNKWEYNDMTTIDIYNPKTNTYTNIGYSNQMHFSIFSQNNENCIYWLSNSNKIILINKSIYTEVSLPNKYRFKGDIVLDNDGNFYFIGITPNRFYIIKYDLKNQQFKKIYQSKETLRSLLITNNSNEVLFNKTIKNENNFEYSWQLLDLSTLELNRLQKVTLKENTKFNDNQYIRTDWAHDYIVNTKEKKIIIVEDKINKHILQSKSIYQYETDELFRENYGNIITFDEKIIVKSEGNYSYSRLISEELYNGIYSYLSNNKIIEHKEHYINTGKSNVKAVLTDKKLQLNKNNIVKNYDIRNLVIQQTPYFTNIYDINDDLIFSGFYSRDDSFFKTNYEYIDFVDYEIMTHPAGSNNQTSNLKDILSGTPLLLDVIKEKNNTLNIKSKKNVQLILISIGYFKASNIDLYHEYSRPKQLRIKNDNFNLIFDLEDDFNPQLIKLPFDSNEFDIEILDIYKGLTTESTALNYIKLVE